MKFTFDVPSNVSIRAVTDDGILIADNQWTTPVLIEPDAGASQWQGPSIDALNPDDVATLLEASPELLVIGTGRQQTMPDRQLVFALARRGIGLEVMDTKAAARTFNVLVTEGRRVAAIFFPL